MIRLNRIPSKLTRDPTRTGRIRGAMIADINRRTAKLRKAIILLVATRDTFGISPRSRLETFAERQPREWAALTQPKQVEEFEKWLQEERNYGTDENVNPWEQYIQDGYERGAEQAYARAQGREAAADAAEAATGAFRAGQRREFFRGLLGAPETVQKVQFLAGRVLSDLKGIEEANITQAKRILVDGLVEGAGPRTIASRMTKQLEVNRKHALRIARTEIIRAHAEGTLDSLERAGVAQVGVDVEFSHSGDGRVCPQCRPLGEVVYKVKDAHGIIPVHPNCRCAFVPVPIFSKDEPGLKRGRQAAAAKRKSRKAGSNV